MSVVALVLAAGSSVRFGADKRRALLADGRSLLVHSVERACAVFEDVRVVLRDGERGEALGLPANCRIVASPDSALGMGHSLAAGAASLVDSDAVAAAILLGDMPWLAPETLVQLVCAADATRIVLPFHDGQQGHPVLFGRDFWAALSSLKGDEGARSVVKAHPASCIRLEMQDAGILQDVDRPEAMRP
ncbi:nucleotidyltransferase family protein [Pseudomonas sp. PSKL.D1]|uniref:nucleotidyltransferase family protein n=1 Tax=Pseudomonas sp. PSKL.D1 TaxID=3029060 RepID=UPI002380D4BB|nr:nucleotidyltransferase family protein [Pseudomonas sp. PSKL.D1]WDY59600.1 nucleotidyltransferase family protein [Pseudomonas sp. PSKL.D1]